MNAATNIRLDTLSTTCKLILMERLWVDLSLHPNEIRSPDWQHEQSDGPKSRVRQDLMETNSTRLGHRERHLAAVFMSTITIG